MTGPRVGLAAWTATSDFVNMVRYDFVKVHKNKQWQDSIIQRRLLEIKKLCTVKQTISKEKIFAKYTSNKRLI